MSITLSSKRNLFTGIGQRWFDGLAKKLVCHALSGLEQGRVVVEEGDEVMYFGQEHIENSGERELVIRIKQPRVWRALWLAGSIGVAEAYMDGDWETSDLPALMALFSRNLHLLNKLDNNAWWWNKLSLKIYHTLNANTESGSRRNIAAHYDLGNDFFKLFLDPSMMYSSAIYPSADADLATAARQKLATVCQKLQLSADDHLLEIGTGWGGMAIYAAANYGCRVTTTTISREQYQYACKAVSEAGLEDRVTVLCQDYRKLEGRFDKLVSIEMIEAVGHEHYDEFFSRCSDLLKDDGVMVIQAITIADQRFDSAARSVDFIKRFIFPGGCLPSVAVMAAHVAGSTDMMMTNLEDIGLDYARTLADWRKGFKASLESVREQGFDDRFCRMWDFYFSYCEGGFRERVISTVQCLFAKPQARLAVDQRWGQ